MTERFKSCILILGISEGEVFFPDIKLVIRFQ